MIGRSLAVLTASAALVTIGVVALAQIAVNDPPDFQDDLATASTLADGSLDIMPTAVGGELTVSGAREDRMVLDGYANAANFGLSGPKGKVFFETDPLTISQMDFDGLAFFPDVDSCIFEPGQENTDVGLVAVTVDCPELVDIRGNGTITLTGYVSLPSDMILEQDLPDTGGTVTVGESTFEPVDPVLLIGADFSDHGVQEVGLWLGTDRPEDPTVFLAYDERSDSLTVARVFYERGIAEVEPGECETETTEAAVVNPQASVLRVVFTCDGVDVSSHGSVLVEGDVTFERIYYFEP